MNGRFVLGTFVLVAALLVGTAILGAVAYNVGLTQAAAMAGEAPAAVPYYGWHPYGYGPGFGFFGLFGTILFIVLVVALIRAVAGRGGGWRGGPWAGPGASWSGRWEDHRREAFDEWHRRAHEAGGDDPTGASSGSSKSG